MSSKEDAPVIEPIEGNMGPETHVCYTVSSENDSALSFHDFETLSFPVIKLEKNHDSPVMSYDKMSLSSQWHELRVAKYEVLSSEFPKITSSDYLA
jgi:hypothetical protein